MRFNVIHQNVSMNMRWFLSHFFSFMLGLLALPLISFAVWYGKFLFSSPFEGLADGVTVSSVRKIEVGMSPEKVKEILGMPLASGPSACSYKIDTLVPNCEPDSYTFVYARKTSNPWHPMLWVHFQEDRVEGVYAKLYDMFDDIGIYGRNRHACKNGENAPSGCVWEKDDFKKYFPS